MYVFLCLSIFRRHVQCVLNFADNLEEDGGTLIVPFFHRFLKEWCRKNDYIRKNLPWVTLPKETESELLTYAHRVTMREVKQNFLYTKRFMIIATGFSFNMGSTRYAWHCAE